MDNNKKEFKPYIPADKVVPEFTVTALLIGILLAIVFGAANAYLGLLVGMTVSASIPAAVISMESFVLFSVRILFSRTTWYRQSVLPESLLQQELSSHFLHYSFGLKKERLPEGYRSRVLSP